ncbi:MAG: hypothetical protein JXM73_15150 [Anaerolineae bacterium]|nr:hypothetical protein [Anaerolineae bacterium]
MAYGPVIPEGHWHVATINPPYGIWMPVPPSSPYERYELSSGAHIESQNMVLELVTNLLAYNNGLLIAILSGCTLRIKSYTGSLTKAPENSRFIAGREGTSCTLGKPVPPV